MPLISTTELLKLQSALLLDPMVKLFSPDLWCRSPSGLRGFGFRVFMPLHTPLLPVVELRKSSRIALLYLLHI